MNIAYLSTFPPYRGGISQFNVSLKKALEKEHSVYPFTFTRQYPAIFFPGKTQYIENFDSESIEAKRVLDTINPFSYISTARKIRQVNPDILLMKYWMSAMAPSLGCVAGKMLPSTKVVAIVDNAMPHEPKFFDKAFGRYFCKRVDKFVVMSEVVQRGIKSLRPDAHCVLTPHPLYDHFGDKLDKRIAKETLGLNFDKKTILFFGLIRDYKGLDILIEAFGRLSSEYQLVIAGEAYGDFGKYEAQLARLPNAADVHISQRYINDDEVPIFFSCADVCVLPYRSATQSGIISIAYHFELPVIVTNVGGLGDYVVDGESGIVVSADVDSLQEGIVRYFATTQDKYVENIKRIKDRYSWEQLANTVAD